MSTPAFTAHVISHTHWDREWYLTVEQYRFRLVRALDRAIECLTHDPAWHSFFLDGQTQMLLDYLEVRPEQEDAVRGLIAADKLRLGPWCVQPDEQLISGEATVRNLLLGRADCRRAGGGESVGYLADNFGHSSQLPQILVGFGLDNAIFWRGYDEGQIPGSEVRWRGADGSEVLAILLARGYSNAAGFPDHDRLGRNLPVLERLACTGHLAITDGIDHALPAAELSVVLQAMRDQFPALTVAPSGWQEYLTAVRPCLAELPPVEGELRWAPGLESTLSNRLEQKQANARVESLLTAYAEPLAALAMLAGARYPDGFLRRAWRLLVKNAAHDSIGGAHTDVVARDVQQRFVRAEEIAAGVTHDALDALMGCRADEQEPTVDGRVALFNPSPTLRSGVVELTLDLPDPHGRDWLFHSFQGIALYDGERRVPVHVLEDQASIHPVYQERLIPAIRNTRTLRLLAEVQDLPPLGVKTLTLLPGGQTPPTSLLEAEERVPTAPPPALARLSPRPGVLCNELVEVLVHPDGRFDLTLLASGQTTLGLNALVDEQDNGNQYNFASPKNRAVATPAPGRLLTVLNSPLRATVRVETTIDLFDDRTTPDLLTRRLGNDVPTVPCPLTIEISLERGSTRVDVTVRLDNRGAGHRLRAHFGALGEKRLRAHTPFDLVDRTPARIAEQPRGITPAQLATLQAHGFQEYLVVEDEAAGLVLAGRGLYEYGVADDSLALTLLRSVGTINYGFERWGTSEGGYLPGEQRIDYAVCPFQGDLFASGALAAIDAFHRPVASRQYPAGEAVVLSGPQLPDPHLRLSTLKRADDRDALILRCYNLAEEPVTAPLPLGHRYAAVWQCRLDETREGLLAEDVDTVTLTVSSKRIVTLELVC
jgi:mannosylglycerate hydrolase